MQLGDHFEVAEVWRPNGTGGKELEPGTRFKVVGGRIDFLGDGGWMGAVIELEDGTTREILAPPRDPVLEVRPVGGEDMG